MWSQGNCRALDRPLSSAVTFDAVTFQIVAVSSDTTDDDDEDKNKYIAVGQAAAVALN
jgi:hypothetical protein